jgi:hypothetical protein
MTAELDPDSKIAEMQLKAMQKRADSCRQAITAILEKYNCGFDMSVTYYSDQRRPPQFDIDVKALP